MTMENFNIEERLTASARDYHDDKLTCLLEEDDINCGSIVYNEKSRVLKYICIYCSMGYDNIEYFCYHLADHIDKDDAEDNEDHVEVTSALSSRVSTPTYFGEAENNKCQSSQDSQNYNEEFTSNNTDVNQINSHRSLSIDKQDDLEVSDIIIEDTEDADDIPIDDGDNLNASALVEECEDIEQLISTVGEGYENVSNSEIKSADRINASPCNTFEECFLKETNIEKIRSQCIVDENKVMYPPPSYRRKV